LNDDLDTDTESDEEIQETNITFPLKYFEEKTVKELRKICICKEKNLRPGKRNKSDLVKHIYTVLTSLERQEKRDLLKEELNFKCNEVENPLLLLLSRQMPSINQKS